MLTEKQKNNYMVIDKLVKSLITRKEASVELGLSLRQIDRLKHKYIEYGESAFIHKNAGKLPINKSNNQIIEKVKNLYLSEYYDYNFEHFYEEIKDEYNISYSSLYREFLNDDIISPIAHKETIKLYKEKLKNAKKEENDISNETIELYKSRIISYEKAHPRKSTNLYDFGQEVQMDACNKMWFGGIPSFLHLAVDKATKKVLFGWFEFEELTRGYFILLYNMIINYGIPLRIKTDNRNSFSNKKNKVDTTQFGIICETLGIELITTSVATAKANVERENKTFKDRLIAELRHENITDIDVANDYLNNVFIPKINKRFSYEINEQKTKMKSNNYTDEELNLIISEKINRIIDNASSIKYNKKYYLPINPDTGEIVHFIRGTECQFIITYNVEYWCKIEGKYYQLVVLENRDSIMKKEIDNNKPLERKKYIPPANHPWRKAYKK